MKRAKTAKPAEKPTKHKAPAKKPKPKAKKSAAKEGPGKPKKPPTAFFYFLEDFRKTFQQENPDVKSMRDEKVQYYDIATEKRAEFEKAMAEYMKKKESGEFSEDSGNEYE